MRVSPLCPFARQTHDAARRGERHETGGAQFDGLFDQPVHLVAAGDALRERQMIWRLYLDIAEFADLDARRAAFYFDEFGAVFAAFAVEQDD